MLRFDLPSKSIPPLVAALCLTLAFVLFPVLPEASDHLDAPGLASPGGDGRLDINDLYAFRSPSGDAVVVLTVAPAAGIFSPTVFHPGASYNIFVDQDGDAREDLTYRVNFSPPASNGAQSVRVRCVPASRCNYGRGAVIGEGVTGQAIALPWGGHVVADVFDDPFFFDLDAFLGTAGRQFCDGGERDFFAGLNTLGIVQEVGAGDLGQANIGIWATTDLNGQVDRVGRPAINTVFIPSDSKNAYNESKPRQDLKRFSGFLGALSGALLPDILTVNTTDNAGFLNGRRLADDVIDIELQVITGDQAAGDCVDENDVAFSGLFPYLATAH